MKKFLCAIALAFAMGPIQAQELKLGGTLLVAEVKPPTFQELRTRALKENKPLVVWVGYVCPSCEKKLSDCLHLRVEDFQDAIVPSVVVLKPENGVLWRMQDFVGGATVEQIREALKRPTAPPQFQTRPQFFQQHAFFGGGCSSRG